MTDDSDGAPAIERGELRLFPLHSVLFPGMPLPLNIFEPRYLQLIGECMEHSEPFGVALIREGVEAGGPAVPFSVGATARLESVERSFLTNLSVLSRGERRFRILQLHDDQPYLRADVEYPPDVEDTVPAELIDRGRALLAEVLQLRLAGRGEYRSAPALPEEPGALADAIGAAQPAAPIDMQSLLETFDVSRRLARAVELLEVVVEVARRQAREAAGRRWTGPGGLN